MAKKPDMVVWSEDKGYYAKSLPYATNVGAPVIKPENLTSWKETGVAKINHYFNSRFEELRKEYNSLIEEFHWNDLLYRAKYSFEPIVGKTYHLYLDRLDNPFLSLISPEEWKNHPQHVGSFELGSGNRWEKISQ